MWIGVEIFIVYDEAVGKEGRKGEVEGVPLIQPLSRRSSYVRDCPQQEGAT